MMVLGKVGTVGELQIEHYVKFDAAWPFVY